MVCQCTNSCIYTHKCIYFGSGPSFYGVEMVKHNCWPTDRVYDGSSVWRRLCMAMLVYDETIHRLVYDETIQSEAWPPTKLYLLSQFCKHFTVLVLTRLTRVKLVYSCQLCSSVAKTIFVNIVLIVATCYQGNPKSVFRILTVEFVQSKKCKQFYFLDPCILSRRLVRGIRIESCSGGSVLSPPPSPHPPLIVYLLSPIANYSIWPQSAMSTSLIGASPL